MINAMEKWQAEMVPMLERGCKQRMSQPAHDHVNDAAVSLEIED